MEKIKERIEVKNSEITLLNGEIAKVRDTKTYKALRSEDYNFFFNKKTGFFVRFGKGAKPKKLGDKITKQEIDLYVLWCGVWGEKFDAMQFFSDLDTDGSVDNTVIEILDFEVSDLCHGPKINGIETPCSFCYKSNNKRGTYMSTEDFKKVIDTMPPSLTQCALGIGDVDQPNLFEMMDYLIEKDIVPNVTINGSRLSKEILDGLSERCGPSRKRSR